MDADFERAAELVTENPSLSRFDAGFFRVMARDHADPDADSGCTGGAECFAEQEVRDVLAKAGER